MRSNEASPGVTWSFAINSRCVPPRISYTETSGPSNTGRIPIDRTKVDDASIRSVSRTTCATPTWGRRSCWSGSLVTVVTSLLHQIRPGSRADPARPRGGRTAGHRHGRAGPGRHPRRRAKEDEAPAERLEDTATHSGPSDQVPLRRHTYSPGTTAMLIPDRQRYGPRHTAE